MIDDKSNVFNKIHPPLNPIDIQTYAPVIGEKEVEALIRLAEPLQNVHWAHINSTYEGGGVAEILLGAVPIARGLGIKCTWYCMEAKDDFYVVTKKMHNAIQGVHQPFSLEDLFDRYIPTNKKNFNGFAIDADVTIVHDPQPCASIIHGNFSGKVIWRCHIDTTEASPLIWDFLLPYINSYDGAVFSHPDYIRKEVKTPAYIIHPAIDPLTEKNKEHTTEEAIATLDPLFKEYTIDPSRPIVLAVSRYDIHKNQKTIITAFRNLKQHQVFQDLKPQLIIVGNLASDDPEGRTMYADILQSINGDPDIYALLNIENNDENIGALMRLAEVFIHVSTKEGFGLVVTEAMWQGTPVIGSDVGGISLQVLDNETGLLVQPNEIDKISTHIVTLLSDKELKNTMGQAAKEHVRKNFLITRLVRDYLLLIRYSMGLVKPSFAV